MASDSLKAKKHEKVFIFLALYFRGQLKYHVKLS